MSDVETNAPETGLDDLTGWFRERLSGQAEPATAAKPKAEKVAEQPEPEGSEDVDAEDDEDATATDQAPDGEADDESADPETGDLTEIEIEPGKKVKLAKELYEQLKPALEMKADYTRKTQEVAERRKAADAAAAEAQQHRDRYVQGLQVTQQFLQTLIPQPPPASLRDEDPIEYVRQKEMHTEAVQKFHALAGELQSVQQHQQAKQVQEFQKSLEEAAAKLPDLIPAWKDPARATKEKKELANYLLAEGYTSDEVGGASDPRALKISRKAMLYDRMMAKKAAAIPAAPAVSKPGPSRSPSNDSAAVRSKRALAKSGRPEDGFHYFKSLLKS